MKKRVYVRDEAKRAIARIAHDMMEISEELRKEDVDDGGAGSGNYGHKGREGQIGGSSPSGQGGASSGGGDKTEKIVSGIKRADKTKQIMSEMKGNKGHEGEGVLERMKRKQKENMAEVPKDLTKKHLSEIGKSDKTENIMSELKGGTPSKVDLLSREYEAKKAELADLNAKLNNTRGPKRYEAALAKVQKAMLEEKQAWGALERQKGIDRMQGKVEEMVKSAPITPEKARESFESAFRTGGKGALISAMEKAKAGTMVMYKEQRRGQEVTKILRKNKKTNLWDGMTLIDGDYTRSESGSDNFESQVAPLIMRKSLAAEPKESPPQSPSARGISTFERTRSQVYGTGNKWAIENFNDTHN